MQLFLDITEQIKREIEENEKEPTTVSFITFDSTKSKNFVLDLNEEDFADKLRYYMTCCSGRKHFYLTDEEGN